MALINKPDYSEIWASGGSIVEPSDVKKQTGWTAEVPPYQWENWIQNRQDQFIAHVNQRGIPQWDGQTEYEAGGLSYVQGSNGIVYKSVAASGPSTVVQDPTSDTAQAYWVTAFVENGALTLVNASQTLTSANTGTVIITASSNITVTLPDSSATKDSEILLQRRDITSNTVQIVRSGTDTIMLDTVANTSGQSSTELLFAGDFLRLRSDGAGKWWCVGQAQLPGSITTGLVSYSTAGAHTFTVPPVLRSGRRVPEVTVCAGGGAGARNDADSGSGGGAGGAAIKRISLAGVTSVPVTVGAGGVAAGSGLPGGSGGASSFGAYCSATGGEGAIGAGAGSGGVGVGGDINIEGQGGAAKANGIGAGVFSSGAGGSSFFSGGGRGRHTGVAQTGLPGGVGGGGSGSILTGAGGAGGVGIVVVRW